LNSRFVADQSSALLSRPELAAADAPARIRRLYDLLYQRAPDAREIAAGTEFVAAAGPAMPEPAPGAAWKYGLGHFDHAAGRVPDFRQMTVYKHDRWQGGDQFPVDGPRGYLSLTPSGGHPGNDTNRSAIRRWVAPAKMRVAIRGQVRHPSASGDGIEAIVVSDRAGRLGSWIVHHGMDKAEVASVDVAAGEAIDFVADVRGGPDSDSFEWAPEIAEIGGRGRIWSAKADFSGPRQWPRGLDAWQQYAQVLLASNEFSFVD
jgi:hypothetical protein